MSFFYPVYLHFFYPTLSLLPRFWSLTPFFDPLFLSGAEGPRVHFITASGWVWCWSCLARDQKSYPDSSKEVWWTTIFFVLFCFLLFLDRISRCSLGWPWTPAVLLPPPPECWDSSIHHHAWIWAIIFSMWKSWSSFYLLPLAHQEKKSLDRDRGGSPKQRWENLRPTSGVSCRSADGHHRERILGCSSKRHTGIY